MSPWEEYKKNSFSRIQEVVTANVNGSTLSQQLVENKHITALYLSQLSYFTFDRIRTKTNEFGAIKLSLYDHKGTQGFFAEFDDMAVVSFRGTQLDQREDLKSSFTFWKQQFGDIKVHKGFAQSIEKLIPNILADLNQVPEGKRVVFVGHSLGGALSTLLSVMYKPNELCTFGAPRVAGPELAEYLSDIEYNRIVTKWDLVRWLPPNIPYIMPYKHSGLRRVLNVKWHWNPKKFIHPHLLVTYLNALLDEDT
jgi:predicted lipase